MIAAPRLASLEDGVRVAVLIPYAVLLYRLGSSGLHKVYPAFAAFLSFRIIRSSILLFIPIRRSIYFWVYAFTEPFLWLLYALIILELYNLALEKFKGIATLARWILSGALLASVIISLISLAPDVSSSHPYYYIHLTTIVGRAVCSSLALFLLAVTFFLVAYPIPLSRNVMIHSVILSVYFLVLAAAYFTHNVFGPQVLPVVNTVLGGITILTLLAWIFLLNPAGQQVIVASRRQWEPDDEGRLVRQLNSINATLLRVARK